MKRLLICFSVLMFVLFSFCACKDDDLTEEKTVSVIRQPGTPASDKKEEAEGQEEEDEESLYIVQEVNTEEECVVLKSTSYDKNYVYHYTLTTRFLDKYGNTTSVLNFTPGSVVVLGDRKSKGILSSIQMSDAVWSYTDVDNFSYDAERNMFSIGGENYKITNDTMVFSNGVLVAITDIGEDDVLDVVGKDKVVFSINVVTGHGTLLLANTEKFEGSLIYIGKALITEVTPNMEVSVPEGVYAVTVANKGYGGTKEVEIVRDNTTVLDLAELEGEGPKTCMLTVSATVPNASIYIDGTQIEAGVETAVTYGRHNLTISVEGYDTWSKTLYVNSETANISIDPTSSDSSKSTESASTDTSTATDASTTTTDSSSTNNTTSSTTNNNQSELDYLSTISSLINTLNGTSN